MLQPMIKNSFSSAFFLGVLLLACFHLSACQKQELIPSAETYTVPAVQRDHCECVDMGCAGSQFLQVEVLEREGLEAFRIELKKVCPASADNLCLSWMNPAPGLVKQTEVSYNIGNARPADGGNLLEYKLVGFFNPVNPAGNAAFARVRLTGPGINQVVIFGPEYPLIYTLCPSVPACW